MKIYVAEKSKRDKSKPVSLGAKSIKMEPKSIKRVSSKSRFLIEVDGSLRWCVYRSEEKTCEIKGKWERRQQRRRLQNAVGDGSVFVSVERKI